MEWYRPTKAEIMAAKGRSVPDVISSGLLVLFCGINPGLYSGAVGHHFARPGNRFWHILYEAGFTDRLLSPFEEQGLLKKGYGITNLVERATAGAKELSSRELSKGARRFKEKVTRYQPRFAAVLGVEAYRLAFQKREAVIGEQGELIGESRIWVLPNPSGANAHYQKHELCHLYEELRIAAQQDSAR